MRGVRRPRSGCGEVSGGTAGSSERGSRDGMDGQFFTRELKRTMNSATPYLTMGEFAKRKDAYLLIVEADGKPIKFYRGAVVRAAGFGEPMKGDSISSCISSTLRRRPRLNSYAICIRRNAVTSKFTQHWNPKCAVAPPLDPTRTLPAYHLLVGRILPFSYT